MSKAEQDNSEKPKANPWVDREIQVTENLEVKGEHPEVKEKD